VYILCISLLGQGRWHAAASTRSTHSFDFRRQSLHSPRRSREGLRGPAHARARSLAFAERPLPGALPAPARSSQWPATTPVRPSLRCPRSFGPRDSIWLRRQLSPWRRRRLSPGRRRRRRSEFRAQRDGGPRPSTSLRCRRARRRRARPPRVRRRVGRFALATWNRMTAMTRTIRWLGSRRSWPGSLVRCLSPDPL